MLNSVFSSSVTFGSFLLCTFLSIILGLGTAFVSMYKARRSQSFFLALAVLPVVIEVVIILVNGSIGAGVAAAGAFSLVRFRSVQGSAREISEVFLAMVIGLADGMGYIGLGVMVFIFAGALIMVLSTVNTGAKQSQRLLSITIPENLDYDGLFDDLMQKYCTDYSLETIKTTNMGTLYELKYKIDIPGETVPKEFIDSLRCRNGNLNISCSRESFKDAL